MNPILAEFTADGQLAPARAHDVLVDSARIPWAYDLNRSGRAAAAHGRVLMALSLAATHLKYPDTQDLEVAKTESHDGACYSSLSKRHAAFAATGARNAANSGSVQPPAQGRRRGWDANLLSHSVLEAFVAASILGGPSSRGRRRLQRRSADYQGQRRALYRHDGAASAANATVRRHGNCFGAGVG